MNMRRNRIGTRPTGRIGGDGLKKSPARPPRCTWSRASPTLCLSALPLCWYPAISQCCTAVDSAPGTCERQSLWGRPPFASPPTASQFSIHSGIHVCLHGCILERAVHWADLTQNRTIRRRPRASGSLRILSRLATIAGTVPVYFVSYPLLAGAIAQVCYPLAGMRPVCLFSSQFQSQGRPIFPGTVPGGSPQRKGQATGNFLIGCQIPKRISGKDNHPCHSLRHFLSEFRLDELPRTCTNPAPKTPLIIQYSLEIFGYSSYSSLFL